MWDLIVLVPGYWLSNYFVDLLCTWLAISMINFAFAKELSEFCINNLHSASFSFLVNSDSSLLSLILARQLYAE